MKIKILTDDIVEVKYTALELFFKISLVINNKWKHQPKFSVKENQNEIVISTGKLKIKVTDQLVQLHLQI